MAKNIDNQLTTSVERGGEGGDDKESIIVEEDGDNGEGVIMALDETNFESGCSRRLLKKKKILKEIKNRNLSVFRGVS
jgi:hypothetical protein